MSLIPPSGLAHGKGLKKLDLTLTAKAKKGKDDDDGG